MIINKMLLKDVIQMQLIEI